MPGFFMSNNKTKISISEDACLYNQIEYLDYFFEGTTLNRFLNDKIFMQNEKYIIILDGIILNKTDLFNIYVKDNMSDLIIELISIHGNNWMSVLRGTFNGLVFDKITGQCNIFVDQVGDKPLFYYFDNGNFFVGSTIQYIINGLRNSQIDYLLDEEGIYQELSYGYMVSDRTFIQKIRRLEAGCRLCYDGTEVVINQYYRFHPNPEALNGWGEDEIIEKLDSLFIAAVEKEYAKDHEYGYKHLAALSGGLDSRMNVWVANELGHDDMLNMSFGQADCLDEKIAKEITDVLGTDLFIKTLNSGKCLLDFKDVVKTNNGLSIYWGAAHELSALRLINMKEYGILHTGQVGDAIVGSNYKREKKNIGNAVGTYSFVLSDKVQIETEGYENEEMFFLYNRGFRGALNGQIPETYYTEVVSPFLYLEFLEFCLNIPLKYRYNHYIYKKWIMKKHPEAGKIPVERWNGKNVYQVGFKKPTFVSNYWNFFREKGGAYCLKLLLKKIKMRNFKYCEQSKRNKGMNPVDLWYETRKEIREGMDTYYKNMLVKSKPFLTDELEADMQYLYKNGTASEKCQVLTVLAAIEVFMYA